MKKTIASLGLLSLLLLGLLQAVSCTGPSGEYSKEVFYKGRQMYPVHGLATMPGSDSEFLMSSVIGLRNYKVNADTGKATVCMKGPRRMSDGIAVNRHGSIFFGGWLTGNIYKAEGCGMPAEPITENVFGVDPFGMNVEDGHMGDILYFSATYLNNGVYRYDTSKEGRPDYLFSSTVLNKFAFDDRGRMFAKSIDLVNGYEYLGVFRPNAPKGRKRLGKLVPYIGAMEGVTLSPDKKYVYWASGTVEYPINNACRQGKITPAQCTEEKYCELEKQGNQVIYKLCPMGKYQAKDETTCVFRVPTPKTDDLSNYCPLPELVVKVPPSIDSLGFNRKGRLFASNQLQNSAYELYPDKKGPNKNRYRNILPNSKLTGPNGLAYIDGNLHVSDILAYRILDTQTGKQIGKPANGVIFGMTVRKQMAGFPGYLSITSDWLAGLVKIISIKPLRDEKGQLRNYVQDKAALNTKWKSFIWPYGTAWIPSKYAAPMPLKEDAQGKPIPGSNKFTKHVDFFVADCGAGTIYNFFNVYDYRNKQWLTQTRWTLKEGLGCPVGVAMYGNDDLYYTDFTRGTLTRLNLDDRSEEIVLANLAGPEGIAIRKDGKIVIAETKARRLLLFSPVTREVSVIADDLPIGMATYEGGPAPYLFTDLAIGRQGEIYMSADLDNTIYRFRKLK